MHIVVCEDEPLYQTALTDAIRQWQLSSGKMDVELSVYASSEDLLEALAHKIKVDLFFIDIQIPGEINGIELARSIRETQLDVTIVFCTNYSEYVYEGYTVNALRYLKKPVSYEDISFCCSYVHNRLTLSNSQSLILFSAGKRYVLQHLEIRSIEVRLHNLYFSTTISDTPLRISAKLADIQSSLPQRLFVLCHRSYIVNIAHVRMLTRTQLTLSDGRSVPISRTYATNVTQAFDCYHQGGYFYDLHDF